MHELSTSKKYPLYSDCMKYFQKSIHYIPITRSTSKKNYPLYSDYMKYFQKNYPLYSDYMKYFHKNYSPCFVHLLRIKAIFEAIECIDVFYQWRLWHGNEARMLFSRSILVSHYQTDMFLCFIFAKIAK